jgi:AmmeMemoRadiSam system protein A
MGQDDLTDAEGQYLLRLARHAISEVLGSTSSDSLGSPPTARLQEPGAAFVTLHTRAGALRGCIGSLVARRGLLDDVRSNALAAAFEDPRFPPLDATELGDIVVEVSVLTQPEPLEYDSAEDLVQKLVPLTHGVIIERGWHRATFLPQVWEQLPQPEEFLGHLCYKAGLSAHAWRTGDLSVATYRVQEFEEET